LDAPHLVRQSRIAAGLTQAELADRLGTTQAAVARLERPGANPTVGTLGRVLHALDRRLELSAPEVKPSIDETLLVETVHRTPAERLAAFSSWYRSTREMVERARRSGGALA
jgi:transcriptional regulator with XRE-family HTH domain